ncbi:MAG TPA: hypothetical protein VK851_14665 [Anaerolineales bacterium]|nr:hypothetical protein [Anaerolineales bacterium]
MSDAQKKPFYPETNFLPPLNMVLTLSNERFRKRQQETAERQKEVNEKDVEKLIEKLSEKEE